MLRETFVRRVVLAFALVIVHKHWIKTKKINKQANKNTTYIKLCLSHTWKGDASVKILSLLKERSDSAEPSLICKCSQEGFL